MEKNDYRKKNEYNLKKKENDTILQLALKYKSINPFILYVFSFLNNCKKNNSILPSINKLAKNWDNMPKTEKMKYEIYTEDIISDKYNIRNIYDAIYGIKPKLPSGALRIFLQIKARNNEINSINDGIKMWNDLLVNEKDKYLKLSHKYYLAFKYKELIFKKKIKRFYPKKPFGPFQFYLNEKKGIKIPEGNNTIIFWREKYNQLNDENKKKYIQIYNKAIEDYKTKLDSFKNKVFDFPESPKNPFSYYISNELNRLTNDNENIDIKKIFEISTRNWYNNKIDKKKYETMANKDKVRYKNEIMQFEKLGYYYKYDSNYNINDINLKYESAPKKNKKKSIDRYNDTKRDKKSLNSKNKTHINNRVKSTKIKKPKFQLTLYDDK